MLSDSMPSRSARLMAARRIRSRVKVARDFAARLARVAIFVPVRSSIHRKPLQPYAVCARLRSASLRCKRSPEEAHMIATKPTTNGHGPTTLQTPVGDQTALISPKHLARIAGILYLLIGIFGALAHGFVYPRIYVAGDATTTAANLVANAGLVRLGVVADFFDNVIWVFLALILYRLLKQVHKGAASAMVVLVPVGAG